MSGCRVLGEASVTCPESKAKEGLEFFVNGFLEDPEN